MKEKQRTINSFDFKLGRVLAKKYEIVRQLGQGWEGEVYLVRENLTHIERAAKFFYPQRNPNNKTIKFYAKKLHKLRHCPILIQYLAQDTIQFKGAPITFLVSDFVEGEVLETFIKRQPGQRLPVFQALHLLYALAKGIESVHLMGEYHGDLHTENIIINQLGIGFEIKLIDLHHWNTPRRENIHDDVCSLIRILHEALGGQKHYAKLPNEVKDIICGLKNSLILKKFKTAGQLCEYLETIQWA